MSYYRELQLIENGQCPCCSQHLEIGEDDQYLCKSCDISIAKPEKKPVSRRKVWLLMFIFCAIFWTFICATAAHAAGTAFLKSQYRDEAGDTHCVYDEFGHQYDVNVGFTGICDFTIETND